ncbi:MAG: AAA family ATPase, partial [Rhodospirillales bacterium]|nr:AAA family ATPase [Rhodospirillales bacterium]
MLRFSKLRLTGFKSFVEPTNLVIEKGLTGVVGPNGCGKSNLVEALKWSMGETSAKQMRGGGMDDVIFSGTATRPARNIAEVILSLDNSSRAAPAQFNDSDELEVSRRIEREKGSTYRVNGKEVRARDVQLLFADSATGARSTALVSQGRIGTVIAAKPTERRHLLEEAAGITGLHSRRHEAELRLRAAETNLVRLEDILGTLETQLQSLKKQSRQATRYRNLSGHIRRAEANLYLLRWVAACGDLEHNSEALKIAEAEVNNLSGVSAEAAARQADVAAGLPALRQAEAEAAAALHRLVIARENLDAEEQRVEEAQRGCEARLEQVAVDSERENALAADAKAAINRLTQERDEINDQQNGEEAAGEAAAISLAEANQAVESLDDRLTALTDQLAADQARRASLTRSIGEMEERLSHLGNRAAENSRQRDALEAETANTDALRQAETALTDAQGALDAARARAEAAETAQTDKMNAARTAINVLHGAEASLTRLEAEEQTLSRILETDDADMWPPLIDAVSVDPGAEAALGAALGEDLSAPADEPAPVHWRTLDPISAAPELPGGAEPLSRYVRGPAALGRRLSQIGVVADEDEGNRLASRLSQGQRLVSREGGLWRWDGYTVSAGAATAAGARLEQRNRLNDVRDRLSEARAEKDAAERTSRNAQVEADEAAAAVRAARVAVQSADAACGDVRDKVSGLKETAAAQTSRLAGMRDQAVSIEADLAETRARMEEARNSLAGLPDPEAKREEVATLRTELAECRTIQVERQAAYENLVRAAEERRRRLEGMEREMVSWRQRGEGAAQRLHHLSDRKQAVEAELEQLKTRPLEIAQQRETLLTSIEDSEHKRKAAADRLAEAEARLADADQDLKAAEQNLAHTREERVRAQGLVEQARLAQENIKEHVIEKLDCSPEQLREVAELTDDEELPDPEAVESRLARLLRERDTMGPVNLRAEQEAKELAEQSETLEAEKSDLVK